MSETSPRDVSAAADPGAGIVRQTVEFLVILSLSIMLFRTFAAEAYVVPTGSMAPTLLGLHRDLECPNCKIRFSVGMDEEGRSGRAICPNCGQDNLARALSVECNGDRLLVQKFLYDLRRPRRWEVAVFQSPDEPSQAYVKRVVGLPGESIQIRDGDVYIDGAIARKSLTEQLAMRVPVYDHNFRPADHDRFPRWRFFSTGHPPEQGAWSPSDQAFEHRGPGDAGDGVDWFEYRHWESDRGRYGPIRDFSGYNGADLRGENPVNDLMLEARVEAGPDLDALLLRLEWGVARFEVAIPVDGKGEVEVRRDGHSIPISNPGPGLSSSGRGPSGLVASLIDRRLLVVLDGTPLFDPVDFDASPGPRGAGRPIAIGARGGYARVDDLRIYRDVYYTSHLAHTPRKPFGVETPYPLGADEYYVLGDNSAVSNDSRFWDESPVVRGTLFLGKPFLVHLPGQVVPLKVFGRSVYWVPDPREIRYIR